MSSIRSASSRTRIRDGGEVDHAPIHQILQPAGRCDEYVSPLGLGGLGGDRDAAVHGRDLETLDLAEVCEHLCHLDGELAGRHEDERGGASVGRAR